MTYQQTGRRWDPTKENSTKRTKTKADKWSEQQWEPHDLHQLLVMVDFNCYPTCWVLITGPSSIRKTWPRYWLAQQNWKEHNQWNQDKRRTEQEDKEPNNKEKTETRHRTLRASSTKWALLHCNISSTEGSTNFWGHNGL